MKKITISSILLCLFIWFFILPSNVKASEMFFGPNGAIYVYSGSTYYFQVDGNHNNLPKTFPSVAGGASQSLGVIDMYFSPASGNVSVLDNFNYNYLIFDTCATGYFQLIISNNGCNNSCVASGTYTPLKLEGTTCSTGNYTGSRYLLQIPVQKWYLNTVSEMLEVSSYVTYKSTASFYISNTVKQIFLSDEDYLQTYRDHAQLVSKLDAVSTAITNMQNNIITNNNTNSQNIINNQNQNAAQAHTDAQNTQNAINGLKDDTVDSNTGKSFFDNFTDNSHGLSSIITAPINMIQQLVNVSPTSCTDLTGTYQNTTFSFACGKLLWSHNGISQFNEFYNLVVGGALCYWIIRDLFLTIEKLKDPNNDKVEVMAL